MIAAPSPVSTPLLVMPIIEEQPNDNYRVCAFCGDSYRIQAEN